MQAAAAAGAVVRWAEFDPATGELPVSAVQAVLSPRTRRAFRPPPPPPCAERLGSREASEVSEDSTMSEVSEDLSPRILGDIRGFSRYPRILGGIRGFSEVSEDWRLRQGTPPIDTDQA